jgi:4a-hydroxytetrahydrobiopterin dehydratase
VLPGWRDASTAYLEKTFRFPDFRSALAFVNRVGDAAERLGHHPGVDLVWGRVTLRLRTHAAGGVTARDLELARAVEEVSR